MQLMRYFCSNAVTFELDVLSRELRNPERDCFTWMGSANWRTSYSWLNGVESQGKTFFNSYKSASLVISSQSYRKDYLILN